MSLSKFCPGQVLKFLSRIFYCFHLSNSKTSENGKKDWKKMQRGPYRKIQTDLKNSKRIVPDHS